MKGYLKVLRSHNPQNYNQGKSRYLTLMRTGSDLVVVFIYVTLPGEAPTTRRMGHILGVFVMTSDLPAPSQQGGIEKLN